MTKVRARSDRANRTRDYCAACCRLGISQSVSIGLEAKTSNSYVISLLRLRAYDWLKSDFARLPSNYSRAKLRMGSSTMQSSSSSLIHL